MRTWHYPGVSLVSVSILYSMNLRRTLGIPWNILTLGLPLAIETP